MNANKKKIDKLNLEYGKNDEKIARLMERQREIEKQRTELENLDIVGMVRELGLSFEELAELINGEKAAAELSARLDGEPAGWRWRQRRIFAAFPDLKAQSGELTGQLKKHFAHTGRKGGSHD